MNVLRYGIFKNSKKRRTPGLGRSGVQERRQRVLNFYIPGDPGMCRSLLPARRIDCVALTETTDPKQRDSIHNLPSEPTTVDSVMAHARWVSGRFMEI